MKYSELLVAGLRSRLVHERKLRKVSKARVAKETGINVATISRIELGYDCHYSTALVILSWINRYSRKK